MQWIKKHWRGLARIVATLLLGVGVYVGYWWFYKLAPIRRTLDPEWYSSHSPRAYWREVQKGIHHGMWSHDDGFTVGKYGDKFWAEWIMARVKPGTTLGCMGEGPTHSATSMAYITNHDLGDNADDWITWWRENRFKTQEEWIEDGFHKHGFEVNVPPTTDQIPVLLEVLGTIQTNNQYSLPREIKYNAFRCLREIGFEPVSYAIEMQPVSGDIKSGLLEYARMDRRWPAENGVGILPFGPQNSDWSWDGRPLPPILTTRFQVSANAIIFGLPLMGLILLFLSFRNYNKTRHRTSRCG